MADSFGKLVVRPHAPKRRAVLFIAAALSALGVLYAAFEFGRYEAGFRVIDSVRGALSASARIRDLEAENAKQRGQLEAAEVARRVDREGYKQVERSLGDMQSQIARLNQDLSFYRGLVQPDSLIHVKVQQMQIVPEAAAGPLPPEIRADADRQARQRGGGQRRSISIDGLLRGKPTSLSFAKWRLAGASAWHTPSATFRITMNRYNCRPDSSRLASGSRFIAARTATPVIVFGRRSCGKRRACRSKPRQAAILRPRVRQMFKQKQNKNANIDTLIGPKTRINGDVEFAGGLHLDGYINGNVKGDSKQGTFLSVSEQGCIEGSVIAPNVILNGVVKGDIEASDRVELGPKARVLGNVHYTIIETAVGAQINGKLIHQGRSRYGQGVNPVPKTPVTLIGYCPAG